MKKRYRIGIDIGSTTVKIVAIDQKERIVYKDYQRHYSDTKKTVSELINAFLDKYKYSEYEICFTGSGAIALSSFLSESRI